MRIAEQVSSRLRDMLTKDKFRASDGFVVAFKADVSHLVKDYFDADDIAFDFKETKDGKYEITVTVKASRIKQFETTMQNRF